MAATIVRGTSCFAVLFTLLLLAPGAANADDTKILDATTGFESLKQLAGSWEEAPAENASKDESSAPPRTLDFKVTSNDSLVLATFYPGGETEMISAFYVDGDDDLIHTHYCFLQNQPTMRLQKSEEPGVLKFDFASGTNLDPKVDRHFHTLTIRFLSDGRFAFVTEDWDDGESTGEVTTVYERKQ